MSEMKGTPSERQCRLTAWLEPWVGEGWADQPEALFVRVQEVRATYKCGCPWETWNSISVTTVNVVTIQTIMD